jgi:hypothetical protein
MATWQIEDGMLKEWFRQCCKARLDILIDGTEMEIHIRVVHPMSEIPDNGTSVLLVLGVNVESVDNGAAGGQVAIVCFLAGFKL